MVKFKSNLERNKFNPHQYIKFIKEPNNRRFHDLDCLLWSKLFNTDKRLNEIVKDLVVDYSYNENDEANRVLIYRSDPSGEYQDIRIFISKMISDKFKILESHNLNEFQIFEIFKASKFKYLTSISKFIRDPEAKKYAETQAEIANIKEPSLSGDDHPVLVNNDPSLSGDDNPAYNPDLEPRLTDKTPIHERSTVETPKNVVADVELTRRFVLKGLLAAAVAGSTIKILEPTDELVSDSNTIPGFDSVPSPVTPPPADHQINHEPLPGPINPSEEPEANENALETLSRNQLIEKLKEVTESYKDATKKASTFMLTESPENEFFIKAIDLISKINLSAEEFLELKLIESCNLVKFKSDKTRIDNLAGKAMVQSDKWLIKLLQRAYDTRREREERANDFGDGNFYNAITSVCSELENEVHTGTKDTVDLFPEIKDVLFDPNVIESILMIEGGFRADDLMNSTAVLAITRSLINSGEFNPNFGSADVYSGKHRMKIALNHILTSVFIQKGKFNNKHVKRYFDDLGILESFKDSNDNTERTWTSYRLKKCSLFSSYKLRNNPARHAPTETKIAEILIDPQASVKLALMSYRENLHYCRSALVNNIDNLREFANPQAVSNFWLKIVASTNICGGPRVGKFLRELAKYPGFISDDEFENLNLEQERQTLQKFAKLIKFSELKSKRQIRAMSRSERNDYYNSIKAEFQNTEKYPKKKTEEELNEMSLEDLQKHIANYNKALKNWYETILNQKRRNKLIYHPEYSEKVDNIMSTINLTPHIETQLDLSKAQALSNPLNTDNL